MRISLRLAPLVLVVLFTAAVFAADDEPLLVRDYQIDGLLAFSSEAPLEGLGLSWADRDQYGRRDTDDGHRLPILGLEHPDDLVILITALIAPSSWEEEGASVRISGGRLSVNARQDVQRAVEALLGDLWAQALTRVRIDARFVTLSPKALALLDRAGFLPALRSGRVGGEAAAAILAQDSDPVGGSAVSAPGVRASIRQLNTVSYVRDFDVEIAQGSIVGDPVIDMLQEGVLLDVRPHLLLDGGLFLEVVAHTATLAGPIREARLEGDALGSLDLPALRLFRVFAAGRLAPGESMAILRESASGAAHVLLLTPGIVGTGPVKLLPSSVLTGRRVNYQITDRGDSDTFRPELYPPQLRRLEDESPYVDMDELLGLLRARVLSEARETEPLLMSVGHRLAIQSDPQIEQGMRKQLLALEAQATKTWRARVRLLEADGDAEPKLLGDLSIPATAGRSVCIEAGIERAYVADWDVEVAQESRIGDPIIGHAFGGVTMNLTLLPTGSRRAVAAKFELLLSELSPVIETRRTGNAVTGIIEIPKTAQVRIQRELVLVPGETTVVDGGTAPSGKRLKIEITVR